MIVGNEEVGREVRREWGWERETETETETENEQMEREG